MSSKLRRRAILFFGCWCCFGPGINALSQELPNLPPLLRADLEMTGYQPAAGSPAIILYYAVDTNNKDSSETHSMRIKVLRDEGRKHANVEIPYVEKYMQVEDIRARTVSPDGKVKEFSDVIYDRDIVKAKKYRVHAKVFTLANVQVGDVIEYSYRYSSKDKVPDAIKKQGQFYFSRGYTYPAAEWEVQRDLFLVHGRFTLQTVNAAPVRLFNVGLGSNLALGRLSDERYQLEVKDIPAFVEEEYSPPENATRKRLNVYYAAGFYTNEQYWVSNATDFAKEFDKFIGNSKKIAQEAARVAAEGHTPEEKLRKLYARAQAIRAMSYEEEKTDQQRKHEHLKENKNAEEVLERGYGYGHDIDLLFIALVRAAGFTADPMLVTSRRRNVFWEDYPYWDQLNALLVVVGLGSRYEFLDPESKFCPYGVLPWEEDGAGGVLVSARNARVGGTPLPKSSDAVTRFSAKLRLTAEETLIGSVQMTLEGQEALIERIGSNGEDEAKRREDLEEMLRTRLAQGATVKLTTVENWENMDLPLHLNFEIEIPNYAQQTGRRMIVPLGVFHAAETNPFASAFRTHPVYFEYPFETYENVEMELPEGLKVDSLPSPIKLEQSGVVYEFAAQDAGKSIKITRTRKMDGLGFPLDQYANVRAFYGRILTGDSQQATIDKQLSTATK